MALQKVLSIKDKKCWFKVAFVKYYLKIIQVSHFEQTFLQTPEAAYQRCS